MDRYLGARWPKGFGPRSLGLLFATLIAAALLGFDPFDPTATHLLTPAAGVANVLGLPGALIGGTLVEWLGAAAFAIPVLILNWSLLRQGRPRLRSYLFFSASALLIAAALLGMGLTDPRPRLLGPGLLGWVGAQWVTSSLGRWPGGALLALGLGYAMTRIVYAIHWAERGKEAMLLARYVFGSGEARAEQAAAGVVHGFVRTAEGIDHGIGALGGAFAGAGRALRRRIGAAFAFAARTRLPRLRAPVQRRAPSRAPKAALPLARPAAAAADGFDAWFTRLADGADPDTPTMFEPEPASAPRPPAPPAGQTPPAGGVTLPPEPSLWEKQFRTYSDNLDLDWEDRVLKARRARRSLLRWDDEEEDQQERG